jgi:hypothetical protein
VYHWSDSAFSPIVRKFDNANAGISADNITEESPVLDYYDLFLLPNMMNIVTIETNKFYKYVTSKTPSTPASYPKQWTSTNQVELCILCNNCSWSK